MSGASSIKQESTLAHSSLSGSTSKGNVRLYESSTKVCRMILSFAFSFFCLDSDVQ